VISAAISFGLIFLYFAPSFRVEEHAEFRWHHLSVYTLTAVLFFGTANVFLFVAPFIPHLPMRNPMNTCHIGPMLLLDGLSLAKEHCGGMSVLGGKWSCDGRVRILAVRYIRLT